MMKLNLMTVENWQRVTEVQDNTAILISKNRVKKINEFRTEKYKLMKISTIQ